MPAPIAVLRDIADRGLDPNKPYGRICSDGRLAHPTPHSPAPVKQEMVAAPKAVERKPHVDPVPAHAEEEATKPSAEVVEEKAASVDSAVETEQATPAAKKGPRGKKPGTETQA